ncbi:nucleoside 2-deoxyribosyltransferase [Paenactinomyces guangxiensis]|uniref:Nucleoside 2-deoxyribosyltransferase n=1 Tax=Paenactinomyces guangxiensis TaxID=1490290 RepID=A0A7W1WT30_9BACL|nr:nucleoside 2-deoxyribosyltransferase [Paenactinomyces guangxiensis]MBA4495477.1 nucleoside 2-deoxyribosyltransferase [Paenactinomyces guangxiensis]MBH8592400.1 nucleoside 2-deoxyribosyltransferase [Paenactinomyces guangxiensis]
MKVYIAIKYFADLRNRDLIEELSAMFEKNGHQTVCVIRDVEKWGVLHFSPQELMKLSLQEIDSCDLVLVDLSFKGVGLGIEAGYAYAKGKPIITIAKKNRDISATLTGISEKICFYRNITDLDVHFLLDPFMENRQQM